MAKYFSQTSSEDRTEAYRPSFLGLLFVPLTKINGASFGFTWSDVMLTSQLSPGLSSRIQISPSPPGVSGWADTKQFELLCLFAVCRSPFCQFSFCLLFQFVLSIYTLFKARSAFSKQLCLCVCPLSSVCLSVTLFCMGKPYLCFWATYFHDQWSSMINGIQCSFNTTA